MFELTTEYERYHRGRAFQASPLFDLTAKQLHHRQSYNLGRDAVQINGAAIESHGGLLTTPYRVKEHTIIQFIGGSFHIGDTTTPSIKFDADDKSLLEMIGVFINSAYGITCDFPTPGSTAIFRDVRMVMQRLSYNNQIVIEKSWNSVGTENCELINLEKGELTILNSTGSFASPNLQRFDLMKRQQLDDTAPTNHRTPSVQGLDYFEAAYSTPIIITNFLHGFPGKAFSLVSHDDNITIQNNDHIWLRDEQDLKLPAKTHIRFQQAFNGAWVQTDKKSN